MPKSRPNRTGKGRRKKANARGKNGLPKGKMRVPIKPKRHFINGFLQGELFPPKMRQATHSDPDAVRNAKRDAHAETINKTPLRKKVMDELLRKRREKEHELNLARLEAEKHEHALQVTRIKGEFLIDFEKRLRRSAKQGNLRPFVRSAESAIKRIESEISVLEGQPNETEILERRNLELEAVNDLLKDLHAHLRTRQ
jgi:hypothetical protein